MLAKRTQNYEKTLVALILGALIFRWFIVFNSPLGLHGDEAQYWSWSQNLDWGYFSKPPLIAWIIAISTSLFGQAEWAIRLCVGGFAEDSLLVSYSSTWRGDWVWTLGQICHDVFLSRYTLSDPF